VLGGRGPARFGKAPAWAGGWRGGSSRLLPLWLAGWSSGGAWRPGRGEVAGGGGVGGGGAARAGAACCGGPGGDPAVLGDMGPARFLKAAAWVAAGGAARVGCWLLWRVGGPAVLGGLDAARLLEVAAAGGAAAACCGGPGGDPAVLGNPDAARVLKARVLKAAAWVVARRSGLLLPAVAGRAEVRRCLPPCPGETLRRRPGGRAGCLIRRAESAGPGARMRPVPRQSVPGDHTPVPPPEAPRLPTVSAGWHA
jgi:hypothetical protein